MSKSSRHVNGHIARKRFGQNFLHDTNIIDNIVSAIAPKKSEHIIEIGPGMGAITAPLLHQVDQAENSRLTVLELDRDLASALRLRIAALDHKNFEIIETNALKYDFNTLIHQSTHDKENGIRVVGNLPYNISTPLLFHLIQYADHIKDMHFMLQKEVVERITALPNTKTYGRLSIMMQYYAKATFLFEVPKGAFNPPPKVTSAVFRLEPYGLLNEKKPVHAKDERIFANVVREAFNQRRKTLRAIFKKRITADEIEKNGIDPMARPENLTVNDFVLLADAINL